jgi:hypothetical protein
MKLGKVNIEGLASGTSNYGIFGKEKLCVPRLEISDKLTGLLIVTVCNTLEFSVVKRNYKNVILSKH